MSADSFPALLIDAFVRSSLVLVPVILFARYARRASAATRHLACIAGLVAVLALPALTFTVPHLRLGLLPAEPAPATQSSAPAASAGEGVEVAQPPHSSTEAESTAPSSPGSGPSLPLLMLGAWALVAGLLTIRVLRDLASVVTLMRQGSRVDDAGIRVKFKAASREIGLARVPGLRFHPEVEMPVTWGLLSSTVLLPEAALSWSASRLRAVFLHELSHVKRRDCLTQLAADLVCAVFWFQPLTWMAARRMREEREAACDDPVLLRGARPSGYATLLLRMLASLRAHGLVSASSAAFGEGSGLERRLRSVLGRERSRRAPSLGTVVAFLAGALTVALFVAALSPESTPEPAAPASPIEVADAASEPAPAVAPEPAEQPAVKPAEAPGLTAARELAELVDPSTGRLLGDEETVKKIMAFAAEFLRAKGPTGGDRPEILAEFLEAAAAGEWDIKEGGPNVLRLEDPEILERLRKLGGVSFSASAGGTVGDTDVSRSREARGRTIRIADTLSVHLEGPDGLPLGYRKAAPDEELPTGRDTLFSREIHDDYVRSTLSFGHATRDDVRATKNSWDLWLNGRHAPFSFSVGRVGGEKACRIVELGPIALEAVTTASSEGRILARRARVTPGHSYLVHTKGRSRDYWTRFRVDQVHADGSVDISWEMIAATVLPRR